jgi:hypothetical protein
MGYVLALIAAVGTLATAAVRGATGVPALGGGGAQAAVIVSHWVANLIILNVTFTFLIVGAVDHRRRARAHALLGGLFDVGARGAPPALAFDAIPQVRAFLAARGVLVGFGAAFHDRLVVVTSAALVVFLAVSLYCLLTLGTASDPGYVVAAFLLLHVLVAPAALAVGLGLYEAAAANEAMRRHVSTVVDARMRLRMAAPRGGAPGRDDALALGLLLEDVERHIAEDVLARPVRILGVHATYALVKGFASGWVSLETAALSLFTLWLRRRAAAAA